MDRPDVICSPNSLSDFYKLMSLSQVDSKPTHSADTSTPKMLSFYNIKSWFRDQMRGKCVPQCQAELSLSTFLG